MRLREIQQILKRYLRDLEPRFHDAQYQPHVPGPTSPGITHPDIVALKTALQAIAPVPGVGDLAKQILGLPVIDRLLRENVVPATQLGAAMQMNMVLQTRCSELIAVLDGILPPPDALAFTIQLPSNATLLDTLLLLARVERILRLVGGTAPVEVRVRTFDPGSLNIELLGKIVGKDALAFYGRFILVTTAATAALALVVEAANDAQKWRTRSLALDALESDVQIKRMVRNKVEQVLLEGEPDLGGDDLARLILSSMQLTRLIQEDVKVIQSLNPPEKAPKLKSQQFEIPETVRHAFQNDPTRRLLLEAFEREIDDEGDE